MNDKTSLGDMLAKRKATADQEAEARRIEAERYRLSKTRQQRSVLEDQFAPLFEEDGVFRIEPPINAGTVRGYGDSRWTGPFVVEITARRIMDELYMSGELYVGGRCVADIYRPFKQESVLDALLKVAIANGIEPGSERRKTFIGTLARLWR